MIAIIDYGMGNLHSVKTAVGRLGHEAEIARDAAAILAADGAILPGVGAFGDAMDHLRATGLAEAVHRFVASGKPLLGICLGMQLLFTESEEHGRHAGLDVLPGRVVRFGGPRKVPHMGWNRLAIRRTSPLLAGLDDGCAYFVHSYHVLPARAEDLLAETDYHGPVTAVVGRGRVFGTQFHPEKSGDTGMRLLANFLALAQPAGEPNAP